MQDHLDSCGHLGAILGLLGVILGHVEAIYGHHEAVSGHLGAILVHLEGWDTQKCRCVLKPFGKIAGMEPDFRVSWAAFGLDFWVL